VIAVLDIDGVLADATHRLHHLDARPKDWDSFFAAVGGDGLLAHGRELLDELAAQHPVVLLSGRPERTREDTMTWLARHGIVVAGVVLRADRDHRPAAVLKADLLRGIGPPEDIALVVDDDASVVDALEALGYRVRLFQ
jgi:hypothetical protein